MKTPWKIWNELLMLAIYPLAFLQTRLFGINIKSGFKFYGLASFMKYFGSEIVIGKNFENRNLWYSNPLGINHPTILATWSAEAKIVIGDDVGISGGCICAQTAVTIGNGTLIGANCTIIDTNFHPIKSQKRRYDKKNIKSKPITIGRNVFIGMNSTILKGVTIPDNTVIPAGSVVRR